jgi:hypothetical protein
MAGADRERADADGVVLENDDRPRLQSRGKKTPGSHHGLEEDGRANIALSKDHHRGLRLTRERQQGAVVEIVREDDLPPSSRFSHDHAVLGPVEADVGDVSPAMTLGPQQPSELPVEVHVQEEVQGRAGSTRGTTRSWRMDAA